MEEHLKKSLESAQINLEFKIALLNADRLNKPRIVRPIIYFIYLSGLIELSLEHNIQKVKINFLYASILPEIMSNYTFYFTKPTMDICLLFLSDNQQAISGFIDYPFIPGSRDSYSGGILTGPMIVATYLLRNDKIRSEEEYYRWIKGSSYKKGLLFYHHLDLFFEGLLNNNEDTIKAGINKILEPHNLKFYIDEYGPWEQEFSTMANFCGKLAWMLGHEIEFENRQIVMDLVRIDPLDKYPTIEDIKREFTYG